MRRQARIAPEKTGNAEQNSGRAYDEERSLPAPTRGDIAADGVTDRASKRNRDIKIGHHSPADRQWKRIGDDRRRGRSISAFAHADKETHRKQKRECRSETGPGGRDAPENYSEPNDYPARKTV